MTKPRRPQRNMSKKITRASNAIVGSSATSGSDSSATSGSESSATSSTTSSTTSGAASGSASGAASGATSGSASGCSSSGNRGRRASSCAVENDDSAANEDECPSSDQGLRDEVHKLQDELRGAHAVISNLKDGSLTAKKETEALHANARSLASELASCKASALESAASLDVARKRLASATGVCNTLIEAVQKGQKSGAYTLEEAANIFNVIKRLQSELA